MCSIAAAFALLSLAADWPQFRGPGGAGASPARGLPKKWSATENVAWKAELPGRGGSSPVVVGDRLFLTCYTGDASSLKRHLVCLKASNGEVVWKKEVPSKLPEQARIREGHGYATNTPAADDKIVVAFFGKSGVFAFDHSGKQLWHADVGGKVHVWGSAASPVLYKGLVLVNASVESESLVALDRKTGKEVWRAKGIRESWATPVLVPLKGGKAEVVVPIFGKVLAFGPDRGDSLWSCNTETNWYMVPSVVSHEGVVYCIGGRTGRSLAVRAGGRGDVTETHRVWMGDKGSNVSSPVYHEGHLYWVNDVSGTAFCADAKKGEVVYQKRLGRGGPWYAAGLLADGKIYYTERGGKTYVLPAKPKFELLATNDLGDRSDFNASPAVLGKRLLIRSDKYLYCLGK